MILRLCYSGLFYLLTPFLFLRLYWRGRKVIGFRQRWLERLALYSRSYSTVDIWFHAVSVGEVESIFPLIKQFQRQYPNYRLLITTTTPTASIRIQTVLGNSIQHVYLPYDFPDANQRFLTQFRPQLAVMVETEIWLNLYYQCRKYQIPITIINARLSDRSYSAYRRLSNWIQPSLQAICEIACQTPIDAQRFSHLTQTAQIHVIGNLKFDVDPQQNLLEQGSVFRQHYFPKRWIWIIASTHKNEETFFLKLYPQLKIQIPELLLIIVPRNMERFSEVKQLCEEYQLSVISRTSTQICAKQTDIYLVDTIGELKMFYATADIAFVGGSLVNIGGHNVLEASALGIPVLFGHYMHNFQAIADGLLAAEAAIQCINTDQLFTAVLTLYQNSNYYQKIKQNGLKFVQQNQGATDKSIALLLKQLNHTV
ncbi:MAG: hypothetical protein RL637_738 [Pseudomonadota bacterium]|jgi:3-deoxy-D-manno-octulosonic-acid transferase